MDKQIPEFITSFTYKNFVPNRLPKTVSDYDTRKALQDQIEGVKEENADERELQESI